jgi:hypothetical protein
MKDLKRFIIAVFIISLASVSFAQTFGVKAGLNLSNMLMKDDNTTFSTDFMMNPGFHVGGTVEFPIGGIFSIEPGLMFSTKGYKDEYKEDIHQIGITEYKTTLNLYYIDVPVYAKATFDVGDNVKLYGGLGPYLGVGLWGKMNNEVTFDGITDTSNEDVKWGTDAENDHFKRVDFGLNAGAGVAFYSILIEVSYGYGLINICPYTDNGFKTNNRVLGISAGYKFGGK